MTDAWDGRPEQPERDGWHWVQWVGLAPADAAHKPELRRWEKDGWWDGSMHRHHRYWQHGWRYLGPALPPSDLAALLAAEREKALREAAKVVRTRQHAVTTEIVSGEPVTVFRTKTADEHAAAILALIPQQQEDRTDV